MALRYVETYFWLPPTRPSEAVVRELLRRIFEVYRWFQPTRYGHVFTDEPLDPSQVDYDAIAAFYSRRRSVTVLARTDRDYIMLTPTREGAPPFVGKFIWCTALTEARSADWRHAHLYQVTEVMRLLGSPLAHTAHGEDLGRKTRRLIPLDEGGGLEEVYTVRDPSEGLAGLYWRNFFGPPFLRMFGNRLQALPPDTCQQLGEDIVLVQPYALPDQALTPEGDAAEERLITVLGPECFYDFHRHLKPMRVPKLPPA